MPAPPGVPHVFLWHAEEGGGGTCAIPIGHRMNGNPGILKVDFNLGGRPEGYGTRAIVWLEMDSAR